MVMRSPLAAEDPQSPRQPLPPPTKSLRYARRASGQAPRTPESPPPPRSPSAPASRSNRYRVDHRTIPEPSSFEKFPPPEPSPHPVAPRIAAQSNPRIPADGTAPPKISVPAPPPPATDHRPPDTGCSKRTARSTFHRHSPARAPPPRPPPAD